MVAIPVPGAGPTGPTASSRARTRRGRGTGTRWRPQRTVPLVALALIVVAVGTAAAAAGLAAGSRARVPNFVGTGEMEAREAARRAHVGVHTRSVPSDDPTGTVLRQAPPPGAVLSGGHAVTLHLSAGPPPVDLPGVARQPEAAATAALTAAGFYVTTEHRTDEDIVTGAVAEQRPPAGRAAPGSEVHLVISDGPRPVPVPRVVGRTFDEANRILTARKLTAKRQDQFSDTVPAGQVISTAPIADAEAPRDSAVTVTVSRGPDLVTVEDYAGMTVEEAVAALEDAGLRVDVVGYRPGRRVKHQDPPERTRLHRNETVTLYL